MENNLNRLPNAIHGNICLYPTPTEKLCPNITKHCSITWYRKCFCQVNTSFVEHSRPLSNMVSFLSSATFETHGCRAQRPYTICLFLQLMSKTRSVKEVKEAMSFSWTNVIFCCILKWRRFKNINFHPKIKFLEQRITGYSDKIVIFRSNVCTQFKLDMLELTYLCGIENIFIELKFHQICIKLSKFHWICVHVIIFSNVNCLQASSLCPFSLIIDIINLPC